jgi:hypothetical protein
MMVFTQNLLTKERRTMPKHKNKTPDLRNKKSKNTTIYLKDHKRFFTHGLFQYIHITPNT